MDQLKKIFWDGAWTPVTRKEHPPDDPSTETLRTIDLARSWASPGGHTQFHKRPKTSSVHVAHEKRAWRGDLAQEGKSGFPPNFEVFNSLY